ncbi:MAG: restriction endonuclease [Phycisphaerales bacterium]|nr:restriction endonuclease [Phycisphaerales bacterium]
MTDLTEAIRQFDSTEANLKRLEDLWKAIEGLIPSGMVIDSGSPDAQRYANHCRAFRHIRKAMPKLDGFELADELLDLDEILRYRFEAAELGEVEYTATIEQRIYSQAESLQEYRFRFATQRRALARSALSSAIAAVDALLARLARRDPENSPREVSGPEWEELNRVIKEIGVLCGSSIGPLARWSDLQRHLHFGLACDLSDIINQDWPAVKRSLQSAMYGRDDPIPVDVPDLGTLVRSAPTGPVITALNWEAIDAEEFERLVYNLVSDALGYSNPQWLTHTTATDRGRDVSANKTVEDALSGSTVLRVIFQCRHHPSRGIGLDEVGKLVREMELWEPPPVDELVIATTGRFTTDAVDWIERHNNSRKVPRITMWPDSHIESLLAARPHFVAQFRLR